MLIGYEFWSLVRVVLSFFDLCIDVANGYTRQSNEEGQIPPQLHALCKHKDIKSPVIIQYIITSNQYQHILKEMRK